MPARPLDPDCLSLLKQAPRIGVAVSGGADSMALTHILHNLFPDTPLFAYTVDHGLRPGSDAEAAMVHDWLSPIATHHVLNWEGGKPDTGIQDAARKARYALLHDACVADDVGVLCLAHHRDDQAETVLHRLAKGSGLDGLSGMRSVSDLNEIKLLRPLLQESHDDLVRYCSGNAIEWLEDPSNENDKFARVRLRGARRVLEAEGLSNERLVTLSQRMKRASDALDIYTQQQWCLWLLSFENKKIAIDPEALLLPSEIVIRLTLFAAAHLGQEEALRANLKRLEEFVLLDQRRKRITLGNLIITFETSKEMTIAAEQA